MSVTSGKNWTMPQNTSAQYDHQAAVNRFQQPEWIVAMAFNFAGLALITWIVACMILYGKRTGKWKRSNRRNVREINAGAVYSSALGTVLVSYAAFLSSQPVFNFGYGDVATRSCELALDVYVTCYSATIISTYIFLWLRQRSLYQHPSMACADAAWLHRMSWSSIVVILGGCLFSGISYIVPQNYLNSARGCVSKPRDTFVLWPLYVGNAVVFFGQGLMLFLFLYPLRAQTCQQSCAKRVVRLLKRSAGFAVLCVISDVSAMAVLAFVVPESSTRHVTTSVYDVSILVNLLSVLLSFESWRRILAGPFGAVEQTRLANSAKPSTNSVEITI